MTTTSTRTRCHTETCTAPATTEEQPVEHDGDDLRRVGEPVPMCEECAEEARGYESVPADSQIRGILDAATVTLDGEEIVEYAECFLAIVQDTEGTLPDGLRYAIDCPPSHRAILCAADRSVLDRAIDGCLEL